MGCQLYCGQAATGLRRSGCWGIRVCLAPPAPTSAGKSLTRLRGCCQPRSHMHDHHLGPAPNAFLSISQNKAQNKWIKNFWGCMKEMRGRRSGRVPSSWAETHSYFRNHTLHLACAEWNLPFCTSRWTLRGKKAWTAKWGASRSRRQSVSPSR